MKLLKKFFGLALNLGSGGLWKAIINILLMVAIVVGVWLGIKFVWNSITYANPKYKALQTEITQISEDRDKYKNEAENLAFENNDLWVTIGNLRNDSLKLEGKNAELEKLRKQQVEQLQGLIKDITTKSKAKDEHILNLESGLMCKTVKVGLFGKKTVTIGKCDED